MRVTRQPEETVTFRADVSLVRLAFDRSLDSLVDREAGGEYKRSEDDAHGCQEREASDGRARPGAIGARQTSARGDPPSVCFRSGEFSRDPAIDQPDHTVGAGRGQFFVVGDKDEGRGVFSDVVEDQGYHLARGLAVEVARRLVGQDDPRPVYQRPRNGDTLALAAAQLVGPVIQPRPEPDGFQAPRAAASRSRRDRPVKTIGSSTFSRADLELIRLNDWNIIPTVVDRKRAIWRPERW